MFELDFIREQENCGSIRMESDIDFVFWASCTKSKALEQRVPPPITTAGVRLDEFGGQTFRFEVKV